MSIAGVLVADPQAGTALKVDDNQTGWPKLAGTTIRVMWAPGFRGRRLADGEVEVLRGDQVVVTTGRHVGLKTQFGASPDGSFPACNGLELTSK
jgi:hypothetical protein